MQMALQGCMRFIYAHLCFTLQLVLQALQCKCSHFERLCFNKCHAEPRAMGAIGLLQQVQVVVRRYLMGSSRINFKTGLCLQQ